MAYRDDLMALGQRKDALAEELEQKTQELNDAAQIYAEAEAKLRLPVLDNLRIATPCHVSWASMTGDERTRHCGSCKKDVFDVSGLTRDEAQALILERNGDLCVRYYQRQDGTILLEDCSIGIGKRRRKQRVLAVGALALLATSSASYLKLASKDRLRVAVDPVTSTQQAPFPAPPQVDVVPSPPVVVITPIAPIEPPVRMMGVAMFNPRLDVPPTPHPHRIHHKQPTPK